MVLVLGGGAWLENGNGHLLMKMPFPFRFIIGYSGWMMGNMDLSWYG